MNPAVQGALVVGSFTLAVAVVGYVFNHISQKAEREERYGIALYEKRLAVHQQAFEWLMKAVEPLKRSLRDDANPEDRAELARTCERADQWWNSNCLYLDPKSRDKMLTFVVETRHWAGDPSHEAPEGHPVTLYREAWLAVQKGIDSKHIDPRVLPEELRG